MTVTVAMTGDCYPLNISMRSEQTAFWAG